MNPVYDVTFEDAVVGQVQVRKQGLYYCLECNAQIPGTAKYHLMAHSESQEFDFGLCIPQNGELRLLTRIPAKRFSDECISFELLNKESVQSGSFVPIRAEEPFAYLQRLETAYLELRNGVPGAVLRD